MTTRVPRRPPEAGSPCVPPSRHPVAGWRDEVDRLFDSFFPAAFGRALPGVDPWVGHPFRELGELVPETGVKERGDHYEIAAELPGLEVGDVELTVRDGVLSIKGETRGECSFGSFEQSFLLPRDADQGAIGAEFAEGVLTVTVPKQEEPAEPARKIEIKPH